MLSEEEGECGWERDSGETKVEEEVKEEEEEEGEGEGDLEEG